MFGLEVGALDGFEDVDIDSGDHSMHNEPYDGRAATRHVNGFVDKGDFRNSEARNLEAGKLRVPSEEAYQQAFLPFRTDTGTPYPCYQSDLDVHNTGVFQRPNKFPLVSAMEATRDVMYQNHVTTRVPPTELVAIDNLKKTVDAVEKRMDFGPDLAVKAFGDLDLLFFGGWLRDNVRVQWVKANDHARFSQAAKRVWAVATHLPERGKCLIKLNADILLRRSDEEDPLRFILGTLLHEMCHAYDMIRCGSSRIKRRGHDEFFSTTIAVVHKRAMRVLGVWAIGEDELYRQYHFFPGEQTVAGMAVEWVMDMVLDVHDKVQEDMYEAVETAAQGVTAVKRWMLAEDVGGRMMV